MPVDLEALIRESTQPGHSLGVVWWEVLKEVGAAWDRYAKTNDITELEAVVAQVKEVVPPVPEGYDPHPFLEASSFRVSRDRSHAYQLINQAPEPWGWRGQLLFLEHVRATGEIEWFPPGRGGLPYRYRTFTTSDGTFRYWSLVGPEWHLINRRHAPKAEPPTLFEGGQ
jgi:hypothetical protein